MSKIVTTSTDLSILTQFITGVLGVKGLFEDLEKMHQILKSVLLFEMIVQVIEFIYYIFIIRNAPLENMAAIRYFDWVITTPVMLVTSIVYYTYEEYLERYQNGETEYKEKLENLNFTDFIVNNKENISKIAFFNILMLIFGYLGEVGKIDKTTGFVLGTVAFVMAFNVVGSYAKNSKMGKTLFYIMFTLWATYGLAYLFDPVIKNTMFNTLDLFSKNFFGVYLYIKIIQNKSIT